MLQENETRDKFFFYATLLAIITLSYSFYASSNYPLLSSDDGMAILMSHYFELPKDMYCWGQDRLGSLIPLISQFFIKICGTSAITAVSLSNYFILILGYIGFSSLFKSRYSKIVFALIWFLPFQRFIDITRFTIGVEYSLIGFSIFLMRNVKLENASFFNWRNHLLLGLITLLLGLSIWASDLAIVSIALLLGVLFLYNYRKNKTILFPKIVLLYVTGGALLWSYFIVKAKSYAVVKTEQFASFNSFSEFIDGMNIMCKSIYDLLIFKEQDVFTSLYTWFVLLFSIIFLVIVIRKKVTIPENHKKWFYFLVLDLIVVTGIILLSHWVLINEMGRRYFVGTYIVVALLVLLVIEYLVISKRSKQVLQSVLFVCILIGSISPFYNMKYITSKSLRSTADLVSEFKDLGEIGIIAEYWNAYRSSCPNPETIKATPHDKSDVRNPDLVAEVFAQPNLYVIRDSWMDEFPDTLQQFGFTLVKTGREFYKGGCYICRYKRLAVSHTFLMNELKADPAFITVAGIDSLVQVNATMNNALNKHIVYGPFCSLLPGKYTVRYHLKATNIKPNNSIGFIDIAAEYGQIPLLLKQLTAKTIPNSDFNYIDVELTIKERVSNVEFRFLYTGNGSVAIDKIELIER